MAARFNNASSQRLVNSAAPFPSTGYPLTFAAWARTPVVGGTPLTVIALSDTALATHFIRIQLDNIGWKLGSSAGSGENVAQATATVVVGTWSFVVGRAISATNRKIAALLADGSIVHGTTAINRAPASLDTLSIGALESSTPTGFWPGDIAEVWYTSTDIQPDGVQLQEPILRQLAYGGPFSVPSIAKDVLEYRSLRFHPDSRGDQMGEVFYGAAGRQAWVNVNGVTTSPHPPLPYWYRRPGDLTRMLMT